MSAPDDPTSPAPDEPRARGRALLAWSAGVALVAALVLLASAPFLEPGRLHLQDMYVDQAGYVTTARILADTGELRNGALFPAQLDRPGFHVHMPGHSAMLALAYVVLGWSVAATLLPSLASFVLCAVGTFLIGNRLEGRWTGALAALAFVLFPANVAYAFTAMAELTFTAACVLATLVFVHLSPRRRWLATPLLLVLPFLFRESGAFLIVPLALVVALERGVLRAAAATLGSVAVLWLVGRWQIASGKLPASLAWVTEGGYNYGDAFAPAAGELTTGEWLSALGRNVERNLALLEGALAERPGELMPWCLFALFALATVALLGGAPRVRRAPFAVGAGLLMALVFALSIALYDVKLHKMMRSAMFTVPFGAVGAALALRVDALAARLRAAPLRTRWIARIVAVLLLAAAWTASRSVVRLAADAMRRYDALGDRFAALIERVHDDERVLIAGVEGAPYAVRHYPVRWCLPPRNEETLELVLERLPVGALLIGAPPSPGFLRRHGLVLVHHEPHTAGTVLFYVPRATAERLRDAGLAGEAPGDAR